MEIFAIVFLTVLCVGIFYSMRTYFKSLDTSEKRQCHYAIGVVEVPVIVGCVILVLIKFISESVTLTELVQVTFIPVAVLVVLIPYVVFTVRLAAGGSILEQAVRKRVNLENTFISNTTLKFIRFMGGGSLSLPRTLKWILLAVLLIIVSLAVVAQSIDLVIYITSAGLFLTVVFLLSRLAKRKPWRQQLQPFPFTFAMLIFVGIWELFYGRNGWDYLRIAAMAISFAGVMLHFSGSLVTRKNKYDLVIAGISFDLVGQLVYLPAEVIRGFRVHIISLDQIFISALNGGLDFQLFLFFLPNLVLIIIPFLFLLWVVRATGRWIARKSDAQLRQLLPRIGVAFLPCIFLAFTPVISFFVFGYLILRYFVIEKLTERPILYFRSFANPDSQIYFGNVVSRVASRYGIVKALVLDDVAEGELAEATHMQNRPQLEQTNHEEWKVWVKSALSHATLVIIDTSIMSESVKWELQNAREALGSGRVLAIDCSNRLNSSPTVTDQALRDSLDAEVRGALGV